jgi:hypothetical protein
MGLTRSKNFENFLLKSVIEILEHGFVASQLMCQRSLVGVFLGEQHRGLSTNQTEAQRIKHERSQSNIRGANQT